MMRFFTLLILPLLMLTSCNYRPQVGPVWSQNLLQGSPEGPTLFKRGWRHGCETGISVTSNTFQRHFYKFTQDASLAQDRTYYTGWRMGYQHCQRYVFQYLRRNII